MKRKSREINIAEEGCAQLKNATLSSDAYAYRTLIHRERILEDPRVRVGVISTCLQQSAMFALNECLR